MIEHWKQRARQLKIEVYAIWLAYRDPRVPWYARIFAACVVGYAFSPIDLIPDPIPVLGYLDDLVLIPLGIALAVRLIPAPVMDEARAKAQQAQNGHHRAAWIVAGVIVLIWIVLVVAAIWLVRSAWG